MTVEIEDHRGKRPKRAACVVPQGAGPGDTCVLQVEVDATNGTLETICCVVPEGCYTGMGMLVEVPDKA